MVLKCPFTTFSIERHSGIRTPAPSDRSAEDSAIEIFLEVPKLIQEKGSYYRPT